MFNKLQQNLISQPSLLQTLRTYATAQVVKFSEFGSATSQLKLESEELPPVGNSQVRVKMLAAAINPADLNVINGTYGVTPQLPAVAGSEGVGVVEEVGSNSPLKVGDWVVPNSISFGTWRTEFVAGSDALTKIPNNIPVEYAATLSINPCTAMCLLNDFENLKSGDVIIQNGANSMVGQTVIQLAKKKGIKTINIIRQRPDHEDIVHRLKNWGADIVVDEQYARTPAFKRVTSDIPAPKLALNCTGGRSATDIARALAKGGTFVTYGGMSRKPIQLPTSLFVFNDLKARGFWLHDWLENNSSEARTNMLNELASMVSNNELRLWIEKHKFSRFQQAVKQYSEQQSSSRKIVLEMSL